MGPSHILELLPLDALDWLRWGAAMDRPDGPTMRQLLRSIELLQHQQEHAEAARLAADCEAQMANEGITQLEVQLHEGERSQQRRSHQSREGALVALVCGHWESDSSAWSAPKTFP